MDTGDISAGVIIRDERGKVILTAWQVLKPCSSADSAVAMPAWEQAAGGGSTPASRTQPSNESRVPRDLRLKKAMSEAAEAEVLLWGIRLCTDWVRQPAMIESDCANIIYALRQQTEDRAELAGVLKEISLLPEFKFQHSRRTANRAAHTSAKHAMRTKECVVQRFDTPNCIRKIVLYA
jgi:hypothetical protein